LINNTNTVSVWWMEAFANFQEVISAENRILSPGRGPIYKTDWPS
jgi:hypothetical protein